MLGMGWARFRAMVEGSIRGACCDWNWRRSGIVVRGVGRSCDLEGRVLLRGVRGLEGGPWEVREAIEREKKRR